MTAPSQSVRLATRPWALPGSVGVAGPLLAAAAGVVAAYLVGSGYWYLALGAVLAVPGWILLHRHPMAVITVWLVLVPFVVVTASGSTRKVFWLLHRVLPLVALLVIVLAAVVGIRRMKLPRLGLPELMMAGYVIATFVSIAYTAPSPVATAYVLYDTVVIPMCLYMIVRLVEPGERSLKYLIPAILFLLVSQALIGIVSWTAPGLLPAEWGGKIGQRTAGSLRSEQVFGVTMLFGTLYLLHAGATLCRGVVTRTATIALVAFGGIMTFLTFSRAIWIAGGLALGGAMLYYRRFLKQMLLVAVAILFAVFASGLLTQQLDFAQQRLDSEASEESALSRLPIVLASVRMFEAKPVTGWGYENFDRFDREFQGRVGDLVYAEKDHASHNLYLTLLAEQGLVGAILFLGPALVWLVRTVRYYRYLPRSGLVSRGFVVAMWLVLLAHFVSNNFSRMQVPFGLGMWWLTLGLIASVVARYSPKRKAEAAVTQ